MYLLDLAHGFISFLRFFSISSAFAAIDADTLATLTSPEGKETLIDILTYHVYPGIVHSSDLADGDITMLNGDMATVVAADAMIANAKVTTPDILVSNGIVHLIDAVMMPPTDPAGPGDNSTMTDAPVPTPAPSSAGIVGSSVAIVSAVAALFLL